MKKKTLLVLGAGYLAGLFVALGFDKNRRVERTRTTDKNWKGLWGTMKEEVIAVHKNLFQTVEDTVFPPEYREKVRVQLEEFKEEVMTKAEELKERWMEKREEIEMELRKIYDKRRKDYEKLMARGREFIKEGTPEGQSAMESLEQKFEEAYEAAKRKAK